MSMIQALDVARISYVTEAYGSKRSLDVPEQFRGRR